MVQEMAQEMVQEMVQGMVQEVVQSMVQEIVQEVQAVPQHCEDLLLEPLPPRGGPVQDPVLTSTTRESLRPHQPSLRTRHTLEPLAWHWSHWPGRLVLTPPNIKATNQSRKGFGFRVRGVGHLHGLVESIAKTVDR